MNRIVIVLLAGVVLAGCQETHLSDVRTAPVQPAVADSRVQRLEAENRVLARQLAEARDRCAALEGKQTQSGTQAQALRAELEAARAENAQQKELLARLDPARVQAQLADAQARSQGADDQLRKWEVQKAQLEKDLLRHERELAVLRADLARRDAQIAQLQAAKQPIQPSPAKPAGPPSVTPAKPAGPAIQGEIIQARADMARANVGSAAGVSKGDKLPIYRGQQLIGQLHVAEVTTKESAGFIVDRKTDVKVGDRVIVPVK